MAAFPANTRGVPANDASPGPPPGGLICYNRDPMCTSRALVRVVLLLCLAPAAATAGPLQDDLAAVTAIDSSGVGMMVAKLKDLQKLGGDMRLLRLTAPCHRLLNVLKLRTTFEVFDDEVTALRSYELRPHG